MVTRKDANALRVKRHIRVRGKISGTAECPRLCVYRSLKNIYAQIIDDEAGVTLVALSTANKEYSEIYGGNIEAAKKIGNDIAKLALSKIGNAHIGILALYTTPLVVIRVLQFNRNVSHSFIVYFKY